MKTTTQKTVRFIALTVGIILIYSLATTPFSEIKQGFLDGFYGR